MYFFGPCRRRPDKVGSSDLEGILNQKKTHPNLTNADQNLGGNRETFIAPLPIPSMYGI